MREFIDIVESAMRFAEKPAYTLTYDEGSVGDVFENPSPVTFKQCMEPYREARGIICDDGNLFIWPAINMYHSDVYDALKLRNFLTVMFYPDSICVKGDVAYRKGEDKNEEVFFDKFTDPEWTSIIRGIRVLNKVYGEGFKIEEGDWG